MSTHETGGGFAGPKYWVFSAAAGLLLGFLAAVVFPSADWGHGTAAAHEHAPPIPLWLVVPFGLMLGSIAVVPFVNQRFWHDHFPDVAFFLGGFVVAYYLKGYGAGLGGGRSYGGHVVLHTAVEYYSFIALVGGLYVISGGILVDVRGRGGPALNTAILGLGAVVANIVGTTGASVLLIRPFMRINKGRLRPIHVVFFIFIVSNCGGLLTPIGDPPLYLGFLKGVPFFWTLETLWPRWLAVVLPLLAVFAVVDAKIGPARREAGPPFPAEAEAEALAEAEVQSRPGLRVQGVFGLAALTLVIAAVFIDPLLERLAGIRGFPVGATFQVLVAAAAHALAPRDILEQNDFSFFPLKEVGLLFVGIFATMMPALGYLAAHGAELGLSGPGSFHLATGVLSAALDNAPTYVSFAQVAFADPAINPLAAEGATAMNIETVHAVLGNPAGEAVLAAISSAAVFFGAMTYIGNGPNFMVKAIAEAEGVRMPSFFAFTGLACAILLPVLVAHWAVFVR